MNILQRLNINACKVKTQMKHSIFSNVPLEEDTRLLAQRLLTVDEQQVLYQKWSWDGLIGESLIFVESDIDDDALVNLARHSDMIPTTTKLTLARGRKGFDFVNLLLRSDWSNKVRRSGVWEGYIEFISFKDSVFR